MGLWVMKINPEGVLAKGLKAMDCRRLGMDLPLSKSLSIRLAVFLATVMVLSAKGLR